MPFMWVYVLAHPLAPSLRACLVAAPSCLGLSTPLASGLAVLNDCVPVLQSQDGTIDYVEFCALMRNENEGLRKSSKTVQSLF